MARKRLEVATQKLKSLDKFQEYQNIFDSWEEEGIIEKVTQEQPLSHYLPHRPVFKPNSKTTPIRPVFDASCKLGRNPSLSECLEKGPNFIEKIPSILLRFRENKIGVVSDIRKAFQMIEVVEPDRDFLRFLWWEDSECAKLKIYRHTRVVFGVNSSPFLLGAVIDHHLANVQPEYKVVAEKLLLSLYVDNCVTSVNSTEEYVSFKKVATAIMADAKMELREWECSAEWDSGIGFLPLGRGLESSGTCTPQEEFTSVLGLSWNKLSDRLSCDFIPPEIPEKISKRIILSLAHKIYDPIGFMCPVLLFPKMIMQESWAKKHEWDEELSEETTTKFRNWCSELYTIKDISIPRALSAGQHGLPEAEPQFHVFSDASQKAYATVVYLRTVDNGEVSVQLVLAKSRVAPLKKMTIPRLELLGCTIAARLIQSVKEALLMPDTPTFFWSDSTTALAWIRNNDDWGTFVGNRVKEICLLTKTENWRHVPGMLNPADLPSRGCSPRELLESRWWEGPTWLKKDCMSWPSGEGTIDEDEVMKEKKKSSTVVHLSTSKDSWFDPNLSTYSKNLRVMGWILRFVRNMKTPEDRNISKYLNIQELRDSEQAVLRIIQQCFPDNIKSNQIQGIKVVKNDDGLFHVRSKLIHREDKVDFKYPILLPYNHPLVAQLIRETHLTHCHGGAQFLLGKLREKYWILQGRKTVRRIIRQCLKCRRFDSKPLVVETSGLPSKRVDNAEVFETTGVDLAGPITIWEEKKTKKTQKVWIVLFTCALYRCIHLDVVTSLSTESFLGALQRFIHQFGRPRTIYSDNGTNFVGAVNLFKMIDWEEIEKASQDQKIHWIFNPPSAPWWGGWWERLVRSVKDLLRRMIDKSKLSYDELRTSLAAVASTINDRPLTTLTEDPDDLAPLTPAMFLRASKNCSFPEGTVMKSKDLQSQYKRVQDMIKHLQDRFRKEYLSLLVQRGSGKTSPTPQIGDVVLIGVDNKKRFEWPLGRILELIPGKDKEVRVAKVKTATGILLRPLQRLYPLEVPQTGEFPVPESVKKLALEEIKDKRKQKKTYPKDEDRVVTSSPIVRDQYGNEAQFEVITRSGRKIKAPCRYGQWNQ